MDETLDQLVRRVDEDRWLASRFAPKAAQARLAALYALNFEIARASETVSNPALGDIKLAWWAEAVEEIYSGQAVRKHPALQAYAEAVSACTLPRAPLDALIAARGKDLEPAPFETWDDLEAYADATAGNVIRLAFACVLEAPPPAQLESFVASAGKAWGICGLMRASAFWRARGRSFFPAYLRDKDESANLNAMLARGRGFYEAARTLAPQLPADVFPAFGYVALAKRYFAALAKDGAESVQTPLLLRQLTLVWSSATGRV
jgi:phytoene synthase